MFYLGYHGGHPDDDYTHSSSVMEKFTKKTIPSYMHRRILATGTEQEMIDLEDKLHLNRIERGKWDKYYNVVRGSHFPIDVNLKHGKLKGARQNPELQKIYIQERRKDPEFRRIHNIKQNEKKKQQRKESDTLMLYDREYYRKNKDRINAKRRENRAKKKAGNSVDLTQFMGFNQTSSRRP